MKRNVCLKEAGLKSSNSFLDGCMDVTAILRIAYSNQKNGGDIEINF
jgi:hypothetical protein